MPPPMGDQDLWGDDAALRDAVAREGADWAAEGIAAFGREVGLAETFEKADEANRRPPELHAFDRNGMRIDQVRYHPAYHELMALAVRNGVAGFAWTHAGPGSQVGHMALTYLFSQAEGGVMCPMAMTYSAIPTLRTSPPAADEWIPRVLSAEYDGRDMPVRDKSGATVGMFMTEKQGGSDVRTNTMRAEPHEGAWRLHGAQVLLLRADVGRLSDLGLYRRRPVLLPCAPLASRRRAQRALPAAFEGQAREPVQCFRRDRVRRLPRGACRGGGQGCPYDHRDGAGQSALLLRELGGADAAGPRPGAAPRAQPVGVPAPAGGPAGDAQRAGGFGARGRGGAGARHADCPRRGRGRGGPRCGPRSRASARP